MKDFDTIFTLYGGSKRGCRALWKRMSDEFLLAGITPMTLNKKRFNLVQLERKLGGYISPLRLGLCNLMK